MSKRAISVTLSHEAILWLRAKTLERGARSLSETLDQLVLKERGRNRVARTVVGTARIAEDDPNLEQADEVVRGLFSYPQGKNHKRKVG